MGGVDAVCAAGKAEGQVNLIATPPDWANYGQMITDFTAKYGIKVQSDQPDADSQAEINAAKQLAGTGRQPDIFDLGTVVALAQHRHVRAVPGRDVGGHPRRATRRPPASGSTTTPASSRSATTRQARRPSRRSPTSPIPKYKGKVALNGDPLKASGRLQRRRHGRARQRRLRRQHRRPASTSSRSSPTAGNLLPVDPAPATIAVGPDADRHRLDVQQRRPDRGPQAQGHRLEGRRPDGRAAGRRVLQRRDQQGRRRIRRPPAAGWSTSSPTPGQNTWLKGFALPVRLAAMQTAGTVDQAALAAVNPPTTAAGPADAGPDRRRPRRYLTANWKFITIK